VTAHVDRLMARLRRVEDLIAVQETLAAYGLTVDGGTPLEGGLLWTDDCVYDSDGGGGGYRTRSEIEAFIESTRRAKVGFAHLTHLPVVVVDGDTATACAASSMPMGSDDGDFRLSRVSANRWELVRAPGGWQVQRRTSRKLHGSPESKELFADGVRSAAAERTARGTQDGSMVEGDDVDEDGILAEMDGRIRGLEDKLAILQVVAGYGPSVDGGAVEEAGSLWTIDSWYDTDSSPAASVPHGRAGIEGAAERFRDEPVGIAHISHLPIIRVDGDRATAVNHSNTFDQDGDGFRIGRVSSNRWDLVRVDGTWQIERRVNRLLNGSRESKDVLAQGAREILGGA
jgi:hypothetical protein